MDIASIQPDAAFARREASHRFLNTLSALVGMLRIDFGGFSDPAVGHAVGAYACRIETFARLLRTLEGEIAEAPVEAGSHLGGLCAEISAAYLAPRRIYCEFMSDEGRLPRETLRALSLILLELVTNAAKHAFIDRADGRIRVALRRHGPAWVFEVSDNGRGLSGGPGGDGLRLVGRLAAGLGSDLQIRSGAGGVTATLTILADAGLLRAAA